MSVAVDGVLSDAALTSPIRILGPVTHSTFSALLDSHKVLLSANGLHRDWRGLAEFARLDVPSIAASSRISFTSHCLHLLGQAGGSVGGVLDALRSMDRHDVVDDTRQAIDADFLRVSREGHPALPLTLQEQQTVACYADDGVLTVHDQASLERGGGLIHYDALLLHADEDIDFVHTMLGKLEGEYGLKICVKDRDLLGGLQFESSSVARLITERCSRVIVLLSRAFFQSPQNKFFTLFAHALSIDQRRRIVIPCMLEPCERPNVINFCHTLDYFRAHGYWDYWKKLRDSLVQSPLPSVLPSPATRLVPHTQAVLTEAPDRRALASGVADKQRQQQQEPAARQHPNQAELPDQTLKHKPLKREKSNASKSSEKKSCKLLNPFRVGSSSSTLYARLRRLSEGKKRRSGRSSSESSCVTERPATVTTDSTVTVLSPLRTDVTVLSVDAAVTPVSATSPVATLDGYDGSNAATDSIPSFDAISGRSASVPTFRPLSRPNYTSQVSGHSTTSSGSCLNSSESTATVESTTTSEPPLELPDLNTASLDALVSSNDAKKDGDAAAAPPARTKVARKFFKKNKRRVKIPA